MSLCRNGWFCTSTDADGSAPRHTANHFRSDSGKPNRANFNRDLKSISTLFQDREFFVFLSVLPFGYKSLLSSGKFSAMENEGLNAVGFWWTKTNLKKKGNSKNNVLRIFVHLVWRLFRRSAANTDGQLQQVCALESNLFKVDFRNGKWKRQSELLN